MLVVVDYGMGNLGSIVNILRRVGVSATIGTTAEEVQAASKLILPGVGAFDNGMRNLDQLGLLPVLNQLVLQQRVPILGICLGMQLLTRGSEEGDLPGLGWIDAETVRFRFEPHDQLKIPHMGWNEICPQQPQHALLGDLQEARFYFVHSYFVRCTSPADVLATTEHGHSFCSAVAKQNIVGTQFHPEKSHRFGMQLFENFVWRFGNAEDQSDTLSAA